MHNRTSSTKELYWLAGSSKDDSRVNQRTMLFFSSFAKWNQSADVLVVTYTDMVLTHLRNKVPRELISFLPTTTTTHLWCRVNRRRPAIAGVTSRNVSICLQYIDQSAVCPDLRPIMLEVRSNGSITLSSRQVRREYQGDGAKASSG
jgi:hypothetical protein